MNVVQLLEFVRFHARGPERVEPGRQPARITYFTVETRDGKRVIARDLTKNSHNQGARK